MRFANSQMLRSNFGKYELVKPGIVSSKCLSIPDHIVKPNYYLNGDPGPKPQTIEIKNDEQIQGMRQSCSLAAKLLKSVKEIIKIGQTTDAINTFVHNAIISSGGYPSPLNYRHFPKSVCTSVNNVACHGIPDDRPLCDGDIINVDLTIFYENYHGDCSKTFPVGNVDSNGLELVSATETCLNEAIAICKPDVKFNEIGRVITKYAHQFGFNVLPSFIGHGIGSYFHGPPEIYHCLNRYPGEMQPGMTFTIEPILTQGGLFIKILEDQWTAITADGARTAQCEHTVLINENGVEILTKSD